MALKFLNKKGWHTGSLRNIENVWKAEQKHEAEQKKLEELRKQIHEEKERAEFRQLQEQAGLVPKQERLDFLYESGLAVGKASASEGFKALEAFPKPDDAPSSSASASSKQAAASSSAVPGALFEEKPHSANDAWRKLHSDPLLMIRQREQEALARIKNNPVQMAMIRKSVEEKKKKKSRDEKEHRRKHHHSSSKHQKHSSSSKEEERRNSGYNKSSNHDKHSDSEDESHRKSSRSEKNGYRSSKYKEQSPVGQSDPETRKDNRDYVKGNHDRSEKEKYPSEDRREPQYRRRNVAPKLLEEERAARLREMQMDAELHEEQRWKRLKKADDDDAREASQAAISRGKNFLDAVQKSVYGTEKGGSSSIAESVRRRTHYSQGRVSEMGSAWILGFYFLLVTVSSSDVLQENVFTDLSGIHLKLYHAESNSSLTRKSWFQDVLAKDEERFKALSSRLAQNEAEITTTASSSSHSKRLIDLKSVSIPLNSGLSIGSGNYFVKIGLGSPASYYPVIMDTGSSFSWLQCQPCEVYCHNQAGPIFDPSASQTYKALPCSASECSSLKRSTLNNPLCNTLNTCIYTASYGDASFSIGYLSQDKLTLTPSQVFPRFVYGCGQDNQGLFGRSAGIIGLARDKLSLLGQVSYKYGYAFSYCLPSALGGQGGVLSIGTPSLGMSSSFKFTPLVVDSKNPSLYFIRLATITVAGKPLGVSAVSYKVPTLIDSGTVITRLPASLYAALRGAFVKAISGKYPKAPAFSILDTCFKGKLASTSAVPLVQLVFAGGAELSLRAKNIVLQVDSGTFCLAFAASREIAIIGNHQQQTFKVAYDVSKSRIGFAPGGCS